MKVEYPKFIYHAKKEAKIVHSKEEHEKAGKEWCEMPCEQNSKKEDAKDKEPKAPKGKAHTSESTEG